jgi:FkbM family methyltransferase
MFKYIFLIILSNILRILQFKINGFVLKFPFFHYVNCYYFFYSSYGEPLSKISKLRKLTIIDVGANIGDSLVNMAHTGNEIYSIEPIQCYFNFLKKNSDIVRKNNKSININLLNSIVSKKFSVVLKTKISGSPSFHKSIVNINKLDLKIFDNKIIDLIKIDTDGFDFDAIEYLMPVILRDLPLLFFEIDAVTAEQYKSYRLAIFQLNEYGYCDFYIFSNYGKFLFKVDGNFLIDNLENFKETNLKNKLKIDYIDVLCVNKNTLICNHLININLFI